VNSFVLTHNHFNHIAKGNYNNCVVIVLIIVQYTSYSANMKQFDIRAIPAQYKFVFCKEKKLLLIFNIIGLNGVN